MRLNQLTIKHIALSAAAPLTITKSRRNSFFVGLLRLGPVPRKFATCLYLPTPALSTSTTLAPGLGCESISEAEIGFVYVIGAANLSKPQTPRSLCVCCLASRASLSSEHTVCLFMVTVCENRFAISQWPSVLSTYFYPRRSTLKAFGFALFIQTRASRATLAKDWLQRLFGRPQQRRLALGQ